MNTFQVSIGDMYLCQVKWFTKTWQCVIATGIIMVSPQLTISCKQINHSKINTACHQAPLI